MRAFVAVDINPELKRAIGEVQAQIAEPALRLVELENLHITLKFLGEVGEEKIPGIISALRSIKASPFEIKLAGLGVFPNPSYIRVVWVGIENSGLSDLAAAVASALPEFRPERWSGHLTICRAKTRPTKLLAKLEQLKGVVIGSQTVSNFCLKKSTLTPRGPIYEDIAQFPLVG